MKARLSIGFLCFVSVLTAQIKHPKASPSSTIKQDIGLSEITVQYSRPAVRGRKIFGDLVPFGRIWRVGANESTKITIDADSEVLGNRLLKGTYALYAFPHEDSWEIIFHKNVSHWGDGRTSYNSDEDEFRITIVPEKVPYIQENFLITFDAVTHNSANMLWIWENTKITIPIIVNTDDLMLKEIRNQIRQKPTAQTYYESARYLQEQERDYATALDYLKKAIKLGGDTYYYHRVKSLVEAGLGNYDKAIVSAQKSLRMAEQLGKYEFVRMNQKNIDSWQKLLKSHKK